MLNLIDFSYNNNNADINELQYNQYKRLFREIITNVIYKMYNFIFNDNHYVNCAKRNISIIIIMDNLFYSKKYPSINANEYTSILEWLLYCNLNRLILYLKMHDANSSSEKIMKSLENDYSLPLFKHRNFINAPNNLSTQYGVINSSIAFSLYHLIKLNIYNTYNNNGNNIKINNYIDINHNIRKIIANDISEILFREYNMSVQNKNNIETKLFNSSKFYMIKFPLHKIFDKVMSLVIKQINDEHNKKLDRIIKNYNYFIESGLINRVRKNI